MSNFKSLNSEKLFERLSLLFSFSWLMVEIVTSEKKIDLPPVKMNVMAVSSINQKENIHQPNQLIFKRSPIDIVKEKLLLAQKHMISDLEINNLQSLYFYSELANLPAQTLKKYLLDTDQEHLLNSDENCMLENSSKILPDRVIVNQSKVDEKNFNKKLNQMSLYRDVNFLVKDRGVTLQETRIRQMAAWVHQHNAAFLNQLSTRTGYFQAWTKRFIHFDLGARIEKPILEQPVNCQLAKEIPVLVTSSLELKPLEMSSNVGLEAKTSYNEFVFGMKCQFQSQLMVDPNSARPHPRLSTRLSVSAMTKEKRCLRVDLTIKRKYVRNQNIRPFCVTPSIELSLPFRLGRPY